MKLESLSTDCALLHRNRQSRVPLRYIKERQACFKRSLAMIQVDVYRLDRKFQSSFEADAASICDTLNSFADRPFDTLAHFIMGEVSVMRVDLGRNGFAILENIR